MQNLISLIANSALHMQNTTRRQKKYIYIYTFIEDGKARYSNIHNFLCQTEVLFERIQH